MDIDKNDSSESEEHEVPDPGAVDPVLDDTADGDRIDHENDTDEAREDDDEAQIDVDDVMEDEPSEPVDAAPTVDDVLPPPYAPAPPRPGGPQPGVTPLVRDPTATLGGIASGIAHRYGWDVALTRIAFFVLILATSGFGLIVYFLAWLIIPRADYWPPAPTSRRRRLSPRDLGIGLAGVGALLALAIGGGEFGAVLIPLALVGGGIWLLVQNPKAEPAFAKPEVSFAGAPVTTAATMTGAPPAGYAYPPTGPAPPSAGQMGAPVPRRSRRRRFALVTLVGMAFLALLAAIAIPIAILVAVNNGDIDFSADRVDVRPSSIEAIPSTIIEDTAEVVLDLSSLDRADFDSAGTPVEVLVDVDFGSIEVIVPSDVVVDVHAEADVGSVRVFGRESDGFGPSRSIDQENPDLRLDLDLNVGEIIVSREHVAATSGN